MRVLFGFLSTFGAFGRLALCVCFDRADVTDAAEEAAEGGREGGRGGGRGDVERARGADTGPGNTLEIGVRDFIRDDDVGIVSRSAAGLDDGVEGRVGGTLYSRPWKRPVVAVCTFALDDAVGVS